VPAVPAVTRRGEGEAVTHPAWCTSPGLVHESWFGGRVSCACLGLVVYVPVEQGAVRWDRIDSAHLVGWPAGYDSTDNVVGTINARSRTWHCLCSSMAGRHGGNTPPNARAPDHAGCGPAVTRSAPSPANVQMVMAMAVQTTI